jgi:cilia- and flagella-associated protein 52
MWELTTGEVIFGKQFPSPVTFLNWISFTITNRKITYEIVYGIGSQVFQGLLYFEAERVQWTIKSTPYAMPPSGGLVRTFHCATVSNDKHFVYVGTTGAEMMVYSRSSKPIFRGAIPVCNHGVRSILMLPDGSVICGGGDGLLKTLVGEDMSWEEVGSVNLGGHLSSLSMAPEGAEVVVGSSLGQVYRCASHDLSLNTCVSSCHLSSVKCVAFGSRSDQFVSGSSNGELRVWDLSDYACQACLKIPKSGGVSAVCVVDPDEGVSSSVGIGGSAVVSGWQDGTIRCHDIQTLNRQIWQIPNAHRGGVTCVAVHCTGSLQYMVSGGADGVVRIWRLSNRELVTQFSEHSKTVTRVLVDVLKPHLVHSASLDMSVLTYDLKTQRRTVSHLVQRGGFQDMTQRVDSEQELITCDNMGRLLHWDCDVRDPVAVVQDPSGLPLSCCVVSPSSQYIAFAGQDATLKVLTIQGNEVVGIGQGHSDGITMIRWTPDEKQIVTVGDDSCICVWNLYL